MSRPVRFEVNFCISSALLVSNLNLESYLINLPDDSLCDNSAFCVINSYIVCCTLHFTSIIILCYNCCIGSKVCNYATTVYTVNWTNWESACFLCQWKRLIITRQFNIFIISNWHWTKVQYFINRAVCWYNYLFNDLEILPHPINMSSGFIMRMHCVAVKLSIEVLAITKLCLTKQSNQTTETRFQVSFQIVVVCSLKSFCHCISISFHFIDFIVQRPNIEGDTLYVQ